MSHTLKCKICGYESGNLVNHIEEEHGDLSAYMEEHGGIDSVIHPELQRLAAEKKKPKRSKRSDSEIAGIKLSKLPNNETLAHYVPQVDESYQFQAFTANVINDYEKKRPTMLIGHTGTGKTSLINQIAARLNQPVIRANMNGQTSVSDFVGFWAAKAGETYWVDGVLPYAMRNGLWLIIDELDFAEPTILSVLNGVLETNGSLVLKQKGNELIKPHENFRIFATANAAGQYAEYRGLYQGTNLLNEAFLDRWRCYIVDYMDAETEAKVLVSAIDRMPAMVAKELVRVANDVRAAFTNEQVGCTFSTRRLLDWAENVVHFSHLGGSSAFVAAESTIFSKISPDDAEIVKEIMNRILDPND